MDAELFQQLVTTTFDRNSAVGIRTRFWLRAVEQSKNLSAIYLASIAPEILKEFLGRYQFGDLNDFIIGVRVHKGLYRMNMVFGPKNVNPATFWRVWTGVKVSTFILLNMKVALNRRQEDDNLSVRYDEWRTCTVTNDWGFIPTKYYGLYNDAPAVPSWDWVTEPGPFLRKG